MKKLLLISCILITSPLVAMQNQIVALFNDETPEDRKIASMLDAYMGQTMLPFQNKDLIFSDYRDEVFFHSYSIKQINGIIFNITALMSNGLSDQQVGDADQIYENFKNNPDQLTELSAKKLQILALGDFLRGKDLPKFLLEDIVDSIMINRSHYSFAWATREKDKILHVKQLQLYPEEAPYISLADQIEGFAIAKQSTTKEIDE